MIQSFLAFPHQMEEDIPFCETHFWGVNHYSSGKLNLDRNDYDVSDEDVADGSDYRMTYKLG